MSFEHIFERNGADKLDLLHIFKYPSLKFTSLLPHLIVTFEHLSFDFLESLLKLYVQSLNKPVAKKAKVKLFAFLGKETY